MMKINSKYLYILSFFVFLFITVGYALYGTNLNTTGNVLVEKPGKVHLIKVIVDDKATNTLPPNSGAMSLDAKENLVLDFHFKPVKGTDANYEVTYLITVHNDSSHDYVFNGLNLKPVVNVVGGDPKTTGATITYSFAENNPNNQLKLGDTLLGGEQKVVAVTLHFNVKSQDGGSIDIGGNGGVTPDTTDNGYLRGTLLKNTIDLTGGKKIDCFQMEVLNTYNYNREFTLSSSNKNFIFVNKDGTPLSKFNISGPSNTDPNINKKQFEVCVKSDEKSIFTTNQSSTSVIMESTGIMNQNIGNLNIRVDVSKDTDKVVPEIADVLFSPTRYDVTNSSLITNVSWKRTDVGGSDITSYVIELYNGKNNRKVLTKDTNSNLENYNLVLDQAFLNKYYKLMVTNNTPFYVKVYGKDLAGNSGASFCKQNNNNKNCVKSLKTSLKYEFNIDTKGLVNMSLKNTATKVYLNNPYESNIVTPGPDYNLGKVTVSMGGVALDTTKYSSNALPNSTTEGVLKIFENVINNDISIAGEGVYNGGECLLEGTKIKLGNNKYKNIEDIKYDDLVKTFSHDLGSVVNEYPIWIEKKGTSTHYQKATFSDGTILKTVGSHGVFNVDLNRYVSVLNREEFHIGTRVIAFDKLNNKRIITVKNIEIIEDEVNYYHVATTRYHNIIANDILTTDAMLVISNLFTFDKDMKWSNERSEFLKQNDLFYYGDWLNYFPSYIFKGFRMEEAKHLYNKGLLDIKLFSVLLGNLSKEPIKNKDGDIMWMVSTSDDLISNKKGILLKQDTGYKLPSPLNKINFIGWYNTSDNKIYKPGDIVNVSYGMYFEALYK